MKSHPLPSHAELRRAVIGLAVAFVLLTAIGVVVCTALIDQPADAPWVLGSAGVLLATLFTSAALWLVRLIDRIHDRSHTDPLTGLMNRTAIRAHLGGLLENPVRENVAVAVLDLDDFRSINDVWGHLVGDAALVEVTERLKAAIGPNGAIGRLGGVEFLAVWITESERSAYAHAMAMIDMVKGQPLNVGGSSLTSISVRSGLRVLDPAESHVDIAALLEEADVALLAAKAQDRELVWFEPTMSVAALKDERLETELRTAVHAGDFEIHFQPEVNIVTGAVTGAEALLRRRQRDGTFEPASAFINDLDRFGITGRLTPLLISECERLAQSMNRDDFTIRLNFNGAQLRDARTLAAVAAAHARTPVDWCLEITEQTITEADPALVYSLGKLVDSGVSLALDDFGTGYSSLSELRDLAISTVKIDRSFVKTLTLENAATSLVSIIHDMAQRLSCDVVAEGIETDQQREALKAIGCRHGQGWLFGKAMPIREFEKTVKTPHRAGAAEPVTIGR